MAADHPEKRTPPSGQNPNPDDELRQALLRLREQGKIKDIPDYLMGSAPAPAQPEKASAAAAPAPAPVEAVPASAEKNPPATSEDIQAHTEEKASWAAVMSGWESPASKKSAAAKPAPASSVEKPAPESSAPDVPANPPAREEKAVVVSRKPPVPADEVHAVERQSDTPWTLQQFFDGEIDLEVELSKRFSAMPMMSSVKFRTLGSHSGRRVAMLESPDTNASLVIDADVASKVIQLSFTYGSMLTLRFTLDTLTDADRSRWLELMRRDQGGLAFLWGPARWQHDYMICISRRYVTNIYAFSPNNFEAAIRLTPAVITELLNWLDEVWNTPDEEPGEDAPLLTW